MLCLLLIPGALTARAEPDPEPPPAVEAPTEPVDLPRGDGPLGEVLDHWEAQERTIWSAGNYLKPTLAMVFHDGLHPTSLGFAVGRRWWQVTDRPHLGAELAGSGDFALARGAGSVDLSLAALGGVFVPHLGLQLGPGLGYDTWQLGPDRLAPATGVDGVLRVVGDLAPLHLSAHLAPRWWVGPGRRQATIRHLDLGDELRIGVAGALDLGGIRLGLGWSRQTTAIGRIHRVQLGLKLLLL